MIRTYFGKVKKHHHTICQFNPFYTQFVAGIIFGCVMLAYLIGTPLAGVFSEMIPPWMCLMIGFSIMGAGLLIFSLSKSVEIVSLSLFLYGFGVGFAGKDKTDL